MKPQKGALTTTPRIIPILHAVAALVLVAWFALIVAWPWLAPAGVANGWTKSVEGLCQQFFCHRMPGRSLAIGGSPLLVCARCTGVIAGYLLGACAALAGAERLPFWRIPIAIILIALMGVSWFAGWMGWVSESWHWERVLAGAFGGLGGYILIARCVVLFVNWIQRRNVTPTKSAPA